MAGQQTVPRISTLTSAKNPLLKDVRRAIDRGALTSDGLCAAESFHLLDEALRSGCRVPVILAAESSVAAVETRVEDRTDTTLLVLNESLFRSVSSTEASQGVVALVEPPPWNLDSIFQGECLAVVLDGIQDPGNCGAIVRAAEAFGATGAVLLKGTVSPYNPKALRASAGSVFRLPLVTGIEPEDFLTCAREEQVAMYAAMPRASLLLDRASLTGRTAIVIGSEGRGVGPELSVAAIAVSIPTSTVESLNASVAAGIVLYEAARQRRPRT
ncbi:MAG TPA: RNA methyltransferase [Bryobacteraceae bacterium]|nr:RNA methyltransferase [Bryobacteraceae bacterium]